MYQNIMFENHSTAPSRPQTHKSYISDKLTIQLHCPFSRQPEEIEQEREKNRCAAALFISCHTILLFMYTCNLQSMQNW
jgi:hypothetical protein